MLMKPHVFYDTGENFIFFTTEDEFSANWARWPIRSKKQWNTSPCEN